MALSATKDIGNEGVDKKPSDSGWYEASETWTVRGATASDTRYTIVNCPDLPSIGTEDSEGVFCLSRGARKTDNPTVWKVDVRYASVSPGGLTPGYWTYTLPSERPTRYQWRTIHYEVVVDKALPQGAGTVYEAIENSAGDPFDPPLTEDKPQIGLIATRFETDFNPQIVRYYSNKVASDAFMGFAFGEARCVEINADPYYENGESGHTVSYNFEFDEDRWVHSLLDAGGRYLDDNDVVQVATDENGVSHGGVVLLDGLGHKLADGDPAQFRNFETKDKVPFAPLGFTL